MERLKIGDIRSFHGYPDVIGVVVNQNKGYDVIITDKGEFARVFVGTEYHSVKLDERTRGLLNKIGQYYKEIGKLEEQKAKISESLSCIHHDIDILRSSLTNPDI